MQHCAGGPGAASFGQLFAPAPTDNPARHIGMAIRSWAETGRTPESVVGTFSFAMMPGGTAPGPVRERLHCAFPARSVLEPGADPNRASSYRCRKG